MNIVSSTVFLTVPDPRASCRFFTSHLGFREVLAGEDFVGLGRDDAAVDLVLALFDPELRPPGQGLADVVVSFAVTDLAAEHERLRSEGATIVAPLRRAPWGELHLRLADPNGVIVQLTEWLPPAGA
ncbi:VOC family protein [Spirillospora sp. CA-253888]